MYAAITTLRFAPGKAEAASEMFGSLVMPAYAERAARGAWIFTRPEDSSAIVIVLYETRSEAEAADEQEAFAQVMASDCGILAEPPRREVYYVTMGTTSKAPSQPLSSDILSLLAEVSRAL